MSETEIETVATIMRETRIAVLFITEADTDKVRAIAAHPEVNIAYATDDGWVSVSGTARRNDDRELLGRLWDASAGAFMEGGPDDSNSTLITVTADTARYWTSPGTVATVVQMAKGLVSDGRPDLGDTGTVSL